MTLTDFLLARIAEDEAVANYVTVSVEWYPRISGGVNITPVATDRTFAPTTILADCKAKRQIVEAHRCVDDRTLYGGNVPLYCDPCQTVDGYSGEDIGDRGIWPCPTLRYLAAANADHPDYNEAWRP